MPIYSYKCNTCGAYFEHHFSTISKGALFVSDHNCSKCGNNATRVIDTPPQVFFKGSGWTSRGGTYYSNPSDPTKGNIIDPKQPGALHRE